MLLHNFNNHLIYIQQSIKWRTIIYPIVSQGWAFQLSLVSAYYEHDYSRQVGGMCHRIMRLQLTKCWMTKRYVIDGTKYAQDSKKEQWFTGSFSHPVDRRVNRPGKIILVKWKIMLLDASSQADSPYLVLFLNSAPSDIVYYRNF